jgi:hypothetical protein
VSVLEGDCVVGLELGLVELGLVGVCMSGLLVLGEDDGVDVLGLDVVLPEVCASIIRLNVNTSEMINKTFFMLFSNFPLVDGAFGEAIQRGSAPSISVRTFISRLLRCQPSAEGWPPFNTLAELRLRLQTTILCLVPNV